jgi:hypothetical protein
VIAALNGDLLKANAGWSKALAAANTSSARIAELEKQVQEERTAAAVELQRQLDQARDAAAAKEQLVISLLLFRRRICSSFWRKFHLGERRRKMRRRRYWQDKRGSDEEREKRRRLG